MWTFGGAQLHPVISEWSLNSLRAFLSKHTVGVADAKQFRKQTWAEGKAAKFIQKHGWQTKTVFSTVNSWLFVIPICEFFVEGKRDWCGSYRSKENQRYAREVVRCNGRHDAQPTRTSKHQRAHFVFAQESRDSRDTERGARGPPVVPNPDQSTNLVTSFFFFSHNHTHTSKYTSGEQSIWKQTICRLEDIYPLRTSGSTH